MAVALASLCPARRGVCGRLRPGGQPARGRRAERAARCVSADGRRSAAPWPIWRPRLRRVAGRPRRLRRRAEPPSAGRLRSRMRRNRVPAMRTRTATACATPARGCCGASGDGRRGAPAPAMRMPTAAASATPAATPRAHAPRLRGPGRRRRVRPLRSGRLLRQGLWLRPWHGPRVRLPALARPLSERDASATASACGRPRT